MNKRLTPVTAALLAAFLLLSGCGKTETAPADGETDKLTVVATVFPAYDFARAVGGEAAEVSLLLPPGAESHSYEPTPADIMAVQQCDLFLYLGGESDTWVETILESVEPQGTTLRMIDCVDLLEEETVEGMESHEDEHDHDEGLGLGEVVGYDEHVWTAPRNAAQITRAIGAEMEALDPSNAAFYAANAADYAGQIEALDREFADFFAGVADRTMVFGDRFPLRYFADEFDIPYYAAFPGCSTQTEPSAATIAFLTEKVREEGISTVWYIEFSNHLVADSIAEAAGAETAMFHSCHNVSADDLAAGATYISLMTDNLETLRQHMC
ncbi:metal ABC transporter substrate-binding protein [Dysosmobacter sp.]|uniref:metal ABC transporter substrate-binding protein n=1 Tax=Dysosmobacter sp. TaxID=2591382 RepID=UPI002A9DD8A5|nr:metal ABC transporter substrate-binding protein [Dysosmobacter sp.]MCI6054493.1 metal ABC transporter substrate-binding protein [Dysosmobacter sp.]MDY5509139.1 metal ABC transporter substrate-binding protein [Dysosmobacter sp.]